LYAVFLSESGEQGFLFLLTIIALTKKRGVLLRPDVSNILHLQQACFHKNRALPGAENRCHYGKNSAFSIDTAFFFTVSFHKNFSKIKKISPPWHYIPVK